jgi:hypothetical protein
MNDTDKSSSGPVLIPDAIKLFNVLNQFLIRWANLSAQYVSMPMEDLSSLHLEQGIYFFEPFEGIFVIRSTKAFEKYLVELATGKKPGRNFHEKGIFLEMAVLFWHLLVSQVWRLDTRTLKPARLKVSVPVDWPDRKPDSACTVFIKDFPLEIRLWAHLSPEEKKRWEKLNHHH